MPIQYSEFRSPKGHQFVKTQSQDDTPEDAMQMMQFFGVGGKYHGRPVLVIADRRCS